MIANKINFKKINVLFVIAVFTVTTVFIVFTVNCSVQKVSTINLSEEENETAKKIFMPMLTFSLQYFFDNIDVQNYQFDKNLLISPFSFIQPVLMLYEGADGNTKIEFEKKLNFKYDEQMKQVIKKFSKYYYDENRYYLKKIDNKKSLSSKDVEKAGGSILLNANKIWVQKDYNLLSDYKNAIKSVYFAQINELDFIKNKQDAIKKINIWVSKKTLNMIKSIVDNDIINENTRLVLTNAIYFNALWDISFDETKTKKEKFFIKKDENGKLVSKEVSMMSVSGKYNYAEYKGYKLIEIPYKNNKYSFYAILPKDFSFENVFQLYFLGELMKKRKSTFVEVHIPSFEIESKIDLKKVLINLGFKSVFSNDADLSKINGRKDLKVSSIIQKAKLVVKEKGTEASAATSVAIAVKSAKPYNKVFYANRPFIFFIIDNTTKAILFIGVYTGNE